MAKNAFNNKFKDSDADGLTDQEEKELGTNPRCPDSDHDGVCDFEEAKVYGTDPKDPDTDKDGLKDGAEIKRGLNPRGPGKLKDLFIPHAGNNFKPQALHLRRLLFHATTAVLIKVLLIGFILVLPMEAWLTPDILVEQGKKIIALTNEIRANLSLPVLAESGMLNQAASDKASDMLLNQYFAHTGPDSKSLKDWLKNINYSYAVAGENLAMGFSSPEDVVNGWSRSQTHYQNMIDPDFSQIGVGLAAGLYQKYDTTFVAQYLATPVKLVTLAVEQPVVATPKPVIKETPVAEKPAPEETPQILSEKSETEKPVLVEEKIAPATTTALVAAPIVESTNVTPVTVDLNKSKIYLDQPQGQKDKIVRAEVYLSFNVVKARVAFNNYFLDLHPVPGKPGKWIGQTIIFEQGNEQIFNPVVLPVLTAEDSSGNKLSSDLKWENIKPTETTKLSQYYFVKQHQPAYVKPLFDLTSGYYKFILLLAIIALGLNVFIQIRKQHPHIILSTIGLIGLLLALIVL